MRHAKSRPIPKGTATQTASGSRRQTGQSLQKLADLADGSHAVRRGQILQQSADRPVAALDPAKPIQRVIGALSPMALKNVTHLDVVRHTKEDGDEGGWKLVKIMGPAVRLLSPANKERVVRVDDTEFSLAENAATGREDRNVELAKADLTEAESWAITAYTSSLHAYINPILGGRADEKNNATFKLYLEEHAPKTITGSKDPVAATLSALRTGMQKLPTSAGTQVTKGVNLEEHDDVKPRYTLDEHKKGMKFAIKELNSTSRSQPFAGRDSLIVYGLPPEHGGKPVRSFSKSPEEDEILFPPGMTYTVEEIIDRTDAEDGGPAFANEMLRLKLTDAGKLKRILKVRVHPVE